MYVYIYMYLYPQKKTKYIISCICLEICLLPSDAGCSSAVRYSL